MFGASTAVACRGVRRVAKGGSGIVKAHLAGLSRTEYLRRTLARERSEAILDVTSDDLAAFADTFADLGDDTVMDSAWR